MIRAVIAGAGKIGSVIALILHHSGEYEILVVDSNEYALRNLDLRLSIETVRIDVTDGTALEMLLSGRDLVISACSFHENPHIAAAALRAGVSYFDLTEDVETAGIIRKIAESASPGQIFMPQCGLAPGFVCILANDLCKQFDQVEKVKMRVGALPLYPSNMLLYNLTWSTDGLINEYCNDCDTIRNGKLHRATALEGLERFSFDGIDYEAFHTSGGLGTLCETLAGRVKNLNYKTVRYRGHQYLMSFLVNGLKLSERRDLLKEILERAIPITVQDVVLIFCSVYGKREGRLEQLTEAKKIYHRTMFGENWSSIQITTGAAVCAVADLHATGKIRRTGFVKQEYIALADFISNRFGSLYTSGGGHESSRNFTPVTGNVLADVTE